jgi:hypothetical protein
MLKYKEQGNKILATKYKCTYSLKNPFLNNAKQEETRIFLISPENKVLEKLKIEK